jgi:cysteine-rich repeat protein
MRRASYFVVGGIVAGACALPDVSIVSSFGEAGGAGRAGADSGDAGEGAMVGGSGGQMAGASGNGGNASAGRGGGSSGGASATGAGGGGSGGNAGSGGSAGSSGNGSRTCGNGTRDGSEACDDGNVLKCGQCAADCQTFQALAPARGSITVTGVVQDGERFILDDGNGGVVFEFDSDGMAPDDIPVVRFNALNDIPKALFDTVNGDPNGLAITAAFGDEPGEVLLTNDYTGSLGNRPIIDEGSGAGLTITGMSGGLGRDCPAGAGCRNDNDCAWNHECNTGVCFAVPVE